MPPHIAALLARFASDRSRPASFLERGLALPFTTPTLLGGRIRPGERRAPELVLANPAGSEGVYILPWAALPDFCPPSLHDRAIWSKVSNLQLFTPRTVRAVTRCVAAEGYAGREAARAAGAAAERQEQQRILLHYHLLLELIRQGEAPGSGLPPPEQDTPANVERRVRAVLGARRGVNGLPPSVAVEVLEELAMAFEGSGLRHNPTDARLPRLCRDIARMSREVAEWGAAGQEEERLCARLLAQAAELTLRCARIALAGAQDLLLDLWPLLPRWRAEPGAMLRLVERPEWVLDGWEAICGLWQASDAATRRQAALEMAGLVPMIPAEASEWVGFDAAADMEHTRIGLRNWRRTVQPNQDWLTGRQLNLMPRYETLRALAA
jgi:hypothetical protein